MEQAIFEVARNYGFSGIVAIFSGMMIFKILNHFMITISNKDDHIKEISTKFAAALENHTVAIKQATESNWTFMQRTLEEHKEILRAVGRQ
jgi:hypothetical protein